MSWESSAQYYRLINEGVRDRLGGVASARTLMWSFDFAEIEALQHAGDWDEPGAARWPRRPGRWRRAGPTSWCCAPTPCTAAPTPSRRRCDIPLLHIADPTAAAIQAAGLTTVGLLGTAFTMEQAFYRGRLEETFGLEVLTPDADDRAAVHDIIYASW
jgi:aspartate racemase